MLRACSKSHGHASPLRAFYWSGACPIPSDAATVLPPYCHGPPPFHRGNHRGRLSDLPGLCRVGLPVQHLRNTCGFLAETGPKLSADGLQQLGNDAARRGPAGTGEALQLLGRGHGDQNFTTTAARHC